MRTIFFSLLLLSFSLGMPAEFSLAQGPTEAEQAAEAARKAEEVKANDLLLDPKRKKERQDHIGREAEARRKAEALRQEYFKKQNPIKRVKEAGKKALTKLKLVKDEEAEATKKVLYLKSAVLEQNVKIDWMGFRGLTHVGVWTFSSIIPIGIATTDAGLMGAAPVAAFEATTGVIQVQTISASGLKLKAIADNLKPISRISASDGVENLHLVESGSFKPGKFLDYNQLNSKILVIAEADPEKFEQTATYKNSDWIKVQHGSDIKFRMRLVVDGKLSFTETWEISPHELIKGAKIPDSTRKKWRDLYAEFHLEKSELDSEEVKPSVFSRSREKLRRLQRRMQPNLSEEEIAKQAQRRESIDAFLQQRAGRNYGQWDNGLKIEKNKFSLQLGLVEDGKWVRSLGEFADNSQFKKLLGIGFDLKKSAIKLGQDALRGTASMLGPHIAYYPSWSFPDLPKKVSIRGIPSKKIKDCKNSFKLFFLNYSRSF